MRIAQFALPVVAVALIAATFPRPVSDPIGVYALIDRVVYEPDAKEPQRVQVWGVFSMADPKAGPEAYTEAQRGYLYYSINPALSKATVAEWSDLSSVAGKGDVIAYGGRYEKNGRIRKSSEKPADPDPYPRSYNGLVRTPGGANAPRVSRDIKAVASTKS